MSIKSLKLSFLKMLKDRASKKIQQEWLNSHGCDSCCPRCKKWESDENLIYTTPQDDGSEHRQCTNCDYEWRALFTPAGFIKIGEWQANTTERGEL